MVRIGKLCEILGNILNADVVSLVVVVNFGFHVDKVDYASKIRLAAYGELNRYRVGLKPV